MKIFKIIVPLSCAILLCSCGTGTSQNEASSDSKKAAAMDESKESATKIYLKDYATMEFDGNDTVGRISKFGINIEQMVIDNSTAFGGSSDTIILGVAEYIDTKTEAASRYLSNGDTVKLKLDDKYTKLEDKYNVDLITDGLEFTVSGLKELEEIDPFEKAELVCMEASKDIEDKSRFCSLSNIKYIRNLYFELDKEVANVGETVTAEFYTEYGDGTTVEQTFAMEGYKPTRTKAEFTVE